MQASLAARGFTQAPDLESAEYHLINTCAFIEEAREETIAAVLQAGEQKENTPGRKLILAGCFAERYAAAIPGELPEVDFSFGTGLYEKTGTLLEEKFQPDLQHDLQTGLQVDFQPGLAQLARSGSDAAVLQARAGKPYAPVKISDGCDRKCAFCSIPSFRGRFRDRDEKDILKECRELARTGVREICLVSQDTNAYGGSPQKLADLLARLEEIEEVRRLRPLYLYPDARTEKLLRALASLKLSKLAPYLESPVQHASPKILKAMKRGGSAESYAELFSLARSLFPELEIRTSFLIGFPGETSRDIDALLDFLDKTRPEKLALFGYSQEENTSAYPLGAGAGTEIAGRINLVREKHLEILKEIQMQRVDRVYSCMADEITSEGLICRRPQDAPQIDEVVFTSLDRKAQSGIQPGDILDVRITGFYEYDLSGVPRIQDSAQGEDFLETN